MYTSFDSVYFSVSFRLQNCERALSSNEETASETGERRLKTRSFRPFPSCLLPLCQSESSCETIHMKMSSAYRFIFM